MDTGILSPHQKAYINRQGMNEHVFCLKTGIDDFKHESSKFYTVFLDFRDAFGTLSHQVMLHALEEIQLPQPFVNIGPDSSSTLHPNYAHILGVGAFPTILTVVVLFIKIF